MSIRDIETVRVCNCGTPKGYPATEHRWDCPVRDIEIPNDIISQASRAIANGTVFPDPNREVKFENANMTVCIHCTVLEDEKHKEWCPFSAQPSPDPYGNCAECKGWHLLTHGPCRWAQSQPKRAASVYTVEALKHALHLPDDAIVTGVEWQGDAESMKISYRSDQVGMVVGDLMTCGKWTKPNGDDGTTTLQDMKDYENSQKEND